MRAHNSLKGRYADPSFSTARRSSRAELPGLPAAGSSAPRLGRAIWDKAVRPRLIRACQGWRSPRPVQEGHRTGRNFLRTGAGIAEQPGSPIRARAPPRPSTPRQAWDIDAGDGPSTQSAAVKSTYGPEVLAGIAPSRGYDAASLKKLRNPVLVSSTDGVGTKVKLAALAGRYGGIGRDIVCHCSTTSSSRVHALFFLDYVATSRLDPAMVAQGRIRHGRSRRETGCPLIGGETARCPCYLSGEFDLAGTIVGFAETGQASPKVRPCRGGHPRRACPQAGLYQRLFPGQADIRQIGAWQVRRGFWTGR